jgi:hypothetical protein
MARKKNACTPCAACASPGALAGAVMSPDGRATLLDAGTCGGGLGSGGSPAFGLVPGVLLLSAALPSPRAKALVMGSGTWASTLAADVGS